jgi:hypothetical protein
LGAEEGQVMGALRIVKSMRLRVGTLTYYERIAKRKRIPVSDVLQVVLEDAKKKRRRIAL